MLRPMLTVVSNANGKFYRGRAACPRVGISWYHNPAETMAAVSVLIFQYGSYLYPALEDGVRCSTFRDFYMMPR